MTGKDGPSHEGNLKRKMIINVCHHFALDTAILNEDGVNDIVVEDDHRMKCILIKFVAEKYFTLKLFNFGKNIPKKSSTKVNKVTGKIGTKLSCLGSITVL